MDRGFAHSYQFGGVAKDRNLLKLVEEQREQEEQAMDEVNRILDKISASGIDSLTRHEKKILENASRKSQSKND